MAESSGENSSQPKFEIPASPEDAKDAQERLLERGNEQKQVSEGKPAKQTPKFQPPLQSPPLIASPQQPQADNQVKDSSQAPSTGLQAQDADLIEKEWVERAKAIVAHTRNDPYKQKSEMSKVKADYLKKRFDKTIPIDEHSKS